MPRNAQRKTSILHRTASWWDRDRTRLFVLRAIAYGLFAASVAGTIYSAYRGVLPLWAVTIYIAFAVQLTFMTFMYAIKHSGADDIHRAVYDLRRNFVHGSRLEREMLAEFTRFAFCTENGVDPTPAAPMGTQRSSLRPRKAPWPTVNATEEVCRYVREDLTAIITAHADAGRRGRLKEDATLCLDFIAYSSETLIELSRHICAEIEETANAAIPQPSPAFPAFIQVRILVRDTDDNHEWLVPLAFDLEVDRQYAADLRTRFVNVQKSALAEFREALKDIASPRNVDFRVRGYRTEPLVKGVLVGRRRGVFGIYTVDDLKDPAGWDYSGHAVTLCACDVDGGFVSTTAAHYLRRAVDTLWDSDQLSRSLDA